MQIIKHSKSKILPVLVHLFNYCLDKQEIPCEWKYAIVTPLYKGKGKKSDCNNYRGISVLSPISKLFEILIAQQITNFFTMNKLFNENQHGFRQNFSCETALHELLNDINQAKEKKLLIILLFIDFKKVFDTVDPNLLFIKLRSYNFGCESINLIENYFSHRKQAVKFGTINSELSDICLGVPQGSILGPLLFSIFINDLPYLLDMSVKLFADDTSLYQISDDSLFTVSDQIINFKKNLNPILKWCMFNKMDINWSKTHIMFITSKRVIIPEEIEIDGKMVQVVKTFKLLGIEIDSKLNFRKHISNTCKSINTKLFSYKKLFYLSTQVKIQFFKTFILPYFDYCLSLCIYFPNYIIQRLCNSYYLCLFKLFGFSFIDKSETFINTFLKKFNLFSFEYRIFLRLCYFSHKILNLSLSPPLLKNLFVKKNTSYNLREKEKFIEPIIRNHYGEATFYFFFTKFINNIILEYIDFSFINFKKLILKIIDSLYYKYINIFTKLQLQYKINTFR